MNFVKFLRTSLFKTPLVDASAGNVLPVFYCGIHVQARRRFVFGIWTCAKLKNFFRIQYVRSATFPQD